MVKLFEKLNLEILYNSKQSCCGQIAFNAGNWKEAKKMATKFICDFQPNIPIVSPSASCTSYLKNYYSKLFEKNSSESIAFEEMNLKNHELSDFLVNHLAVRDISASFPHKVTFHDSCSGLREYKLKNEARILLKHVKGLELIEMENLDECCGFGGTFAVKHKHISQAMVEQKVENALNTGAEYITSTETSCLLNINSYIKKHKLPLKAIHFSEIITSGW